MEIRNDITSRPKTATPSFGAIDYTMAKDTLRQVLSLEELEKLKKLVIEHQKYNNADLILFGDGKNLHARLADNVTLKGGKTTEHSPWFFENKFNWIAKMAAKMRKRHNEVTELLNKQNFQF